MTHRVGDYTLIMKENYVFHDTLPNKEVHFEIGNHGGTSEKEMYVPYDRVGQRSVLRKTDKVYFLELHTY